METPIYPESRQRAACSMNSAAEAPGVSSFSLRQRMLAGNTSQTMLRDDGMPMTLDFPLKSGVDLNAQIAPGGSKRTLLGYGKRASLRGRLLDAAGEPLPNKPVVVDEDFGEGALIDHRVRTVMTDDTAVGPPSFLQGQVAQSRLGMRATSAT